MMKRVLLCSLSAILLAACIHSLPTIGWREKADELSSGKTKGSKLWAKNNGGFNGNDNHDGKP